MTTYYCAERAVDQHLRTIYYYMRHGQYEKAIFQLRDTLRTLCTGQFLQDAFLLQTVQSLAGALNALHTKDHGRAHSSIRDLHYKILETMLDKVHGYL